MLGDTNVVSNHKVVGVSNVICETDGTVGNCSVGESADSGMEFGQVQRRRER